jgi:hypothetical protein
MNQLSEHQNEILDWKIDCLISTKWYDGPTEGVCKLSFPDSVLFLDLILESPFPSDSRIYKVKFTSEEHFEELFKSLSQLEVPKRPIWAPTWNYDLVDVAKLNNVFETLKHNSVESGLYLEASFDEEFHFRRLWQTANVI